MMPRKQMTIYRWQVVLVFSLFVAVTVGTLWWVDHESKARSNENRTLIEERQKEEQAANQAEVEGCYESNAQGPALQRLLVAVREGRTPLAQRYIDEYIELLRLNTPSVPECNRLADQLGIPRTIR